MGTGALGEQQHGEAATLNALECTQTNEQQASKGKPRGRKMPLERAQMNADAFTLVRVGVACRLFHQRPAQLRGQHSATLD